MAKIPYISKAFRKDSLGIIALANEICEEYERQGFVITLRQLYYQFVARGLLGNTQQNYNRLGSIVNDGRLAGFIDWGHLEDRTRNLSDLAHWRSPESILEAVASQYRTDRWADQPERVEVWVEKEALAGVIAPTCQGLDVPYFSCRGYVSQSEMHSAALRHISRYSEYSQRTTIIHLGDHDPSGIDMTRDIQDRLALFRAPTTVVRIALTMDQVEQYQPPPNPAKVTDARFAGYQEVFGDESWELDALDPATLAALITSEVREHWDEEIWASSTEVMRGDRSALNACASNWLDLREHMESEGWL